MVSLCYPTVLVLHGHIILWLHLDTGVQVACTCIDYPRLFRSVVYYFSVADLLRPAYFMIYS